MRKSVFVSLLYSYKSFSLNHWKIIFLEILFHLISCRIMFSVFSNILLTLFLVSMNLGFMLVVYWTTNCLWREVCSANNVVTRAEVYICLFSFSPPRFIICKRNSPSDIFPVPSFPVTKYTTCSSGTLFLLTGLLLGKEKKNMLECSDTNAYYISWYGRLYRITNFTSKVSFMRNSSTWKLQSFLYIGKY